MVRVLPPHIHAPYYTSHTFPESNKSNKEEWQLDSQLGVDEALEPVRNRSRHERVLEGGDVVDRELS
jgi:hypothetical protein